jgi:hypothetical protein
VRPVIFTDAELKAVPESDAAGVTAYREALSKLLGKMEGGKPEAQSLPHEEIISKLDEAGKTFPYPSAENQDDDSLYVGVSPVGVRILDGGGGEEAAGEDAPRAGCSLTGLLV